MVRKQREREITVERTVKQIEQKCPVCGVTFWGAKISRYCRKRACRNKANYERHAEEYRQKRRESYRKQKEPAAK
jgi:hypothetical protein